MTQSRCRSVRCRNGQIAVPRLFRASALRRDRLWSNAHPSRRCSVPSTTLSRSITSSEPERVFAVHGPSRMLLRSEAGSRGASARIRLRITSSWYSRLMTCVVNPSCRRRQGRLRRHEDARLRYRSADAGRQHPQVPSSIGMQAGHPYTDRRDPAWFRCFFTSTG